MRKKLSLPAKLRSYLRPAGLFALTFALFMGEAAGVAASLCVKNNVEPKDVDITALRQILKSNGSNI